MGNGNGERSGAEEVGGGGTGTVERRTAADRRRQVKATDEGLSLLLAGLSAMEGGDFSFRLPEADGLIGEVTAAYNAVAARSAALSGELVRVGRIIGREGRMTERASLGGAEGLWVTSTAAVNAMIDDLVRPTTEVARVIDAVAEGDLSQKMALEIEGQPVKGEFLRIGTTVNAMVDQLGSFADEVTRVAKEVGTEGMLGGQATVEGVSGTWKDLTDNVNQLAGNLTDQVRDIASVTTAVAEGDLSRKITVEARGETARLKDTINTMVDQLGSFADEVTRVAREVGTEGILGGQARVEGVSGTWRDLTDSVNFMAGNLTSQVRNIAQVTTAVAQGDLGQKITVDARGETLELKETINTMVDQLGSFADEVTRVAREVGTEGILGGQARVEGVSGTWRDLTDNVNSMAGNLTSQVRNIAQVTTAVAQGDLGQKITVDARGETMELKETINTMVDQLGSFSAEVTRVAREVGTEGMLGGQAKVEGVSGTWRDLTDNVNFMAGNLTSQVRDIASVTTAVANGDLGQKITVDAKGETLELKDTINTMVDQLRSFAAEVTRVAHEVGTEGILGGQAEVVGVSGTWKDLTDSVNSMAGNLTNQVRNIAMVTTAVAQGDLGQKITVDVKGETLDLKRTINTMVDQLSAFAAEVTRVAREVGTEGKLGGQARVEDVEGTWRDLTDNVNFMAGNLTSQVRNIAMVTTAVAQGDLGQKITVDAEGETLELKDTINTMVDQLSAFASEVTRVAREVGTEGKLGGQAKVEGVSGTWRDLTDNVNQLAGNLTSQVRDIASVTTAVAQGDLSRKITVDARGETAQLKETINTMVDQLRAFSAEVTRVAKEVGTEGMLGGQARVEGVSGTWRDLTDNVNFMAGNLTSQVRDIASVTTAVANGDLGQKITVDAKGETLKLKDTINTMVDQLRAFSAEVTRVAHEVGTEGILGGQAGVPGVGGTWKALTDSVNDMASNLTGQVRNIAQVTTAVAQGDLSQKITVDARGETMELKETINTMVDQLGSFADEVTRVAREVGTEGKLGGQARVEGVSGTWKSLTDNVNLLAGNLTAQVRAMAEVSTAVTAGDLSRSITVDALGEVAELKDNVNQMIANLRETTSINAEQDWLKTNVAKISQQLQGQRDLQAVSQLIMSEVTPLVSASHGAFFFGEQADGEQRFRLRASYGYKARKGLNNVFHVGEGLVGQAVLERSSILLTEAPPDYIKVNSGLGESSPVNIIVLPVVFEDAVLAVIELATFRPFNEVNLTFLDQLVETLGVVLNTIMANVRTEELLQQSQGLTQELQSQSEELQSQQEELRRSNGELENQARSLKASEELLQRQQEELQQTNDELEEKASLLVDQNRDIEVKNQEIEDARGVLEEKARQLSLSSKYKSEFLANMSHELRTPLNSLLILAKVLSENGEGNLSDKQMQFASTIHGAGSDLLSLINDILDLSKVEAGKMDVHPAPVELAEVGGFVERTFGPVADTQGLALVVEQLPGAPVSLVTDEQRLQQVLKNLLSNALKFTEVGSVALRMAPAPGGVAFVVEDTGIGMGTDKLALIFEAFQQADGTTSRKYGGTGLGLSISREIARLLGGEISVSSTLGQGSTFTLTLPVEWTGGGGDGGDGGSSPEPPAHPAPVLARPAPPAPRPAPPARPRAAGPDADDRATLAEGDRTLLIVDDDPAAAATALELGRRRGFKGIVAATGEEGLALANEYRPDAIVLDLDLPGADALGVLDRLKHHPGTRHIPVHVVSDPDSRQHALRAGAVSFLEGPADADTFERAFSELADALDDPVRRVLVVDDDPAARTAVVELIGGGDDVEVVAVGSSDEAFAALGQQRFSCMVLDLRLPDTSGFVILEQLKGDPRWVDLPVLVHTARDLTRAEELELKRHASAIIVKDARSPERLLHETTLFLHQVEARLPVEKRKMLEQLHSADAVFSGRKVLVVDDDVRNIFALTSALEARGIDVLFAENGRDGIEVLTRNPGVDLVLMDVMMPGMDGYETTRAIRELPQFDRLPIISLTAKAMKGDRAKSIESGASDYITKPVEVDQLLSLMRVWLYR